MPLRKPTIPLLVLAAFAPWNSAGCIRKAPVQGSPESSAQSASAVISLEDYIASCEAQLGPLPDEINCAPSESTPPLGFTDLDLVNLKGGQSLHTCSNPSFGSLLAEACLGESRLYSEVNERGSRSVAVCRKLVRNGGLNFLTAMISNNEVTGATCFFLYQKKTPFVESAILPGPGYKGRDEQKSPSKNWQTPQYVTNDVLGTCVECHSASPWIRNSSIAGKDQDGNWIVPQGARMNSSPKNYWVVERHRLAQIPIHRKDSEPYLAGHRWSPIVLRADAFPKGAKEGYCTSCHAVGAGDFLNLYAPAVAGFVVEPDNPLYMGLFRSRILRNLKTLKWPNQAWHSSVLMGKVPGPKMSKEDWYERTQPAIELYLACRASPEKCAWKGLPEPSNPSELRSADVAPIHWTDAPLAPPFNSSGFDFPFHSK